MLTIATQRVRLRSLRSLPLLPFAIRQVHAIVPDRCLLRFQGKDTLKLLQNLTTNDVAKVIGPKADPNNTAQWTAFLTPQGRALGFGFLWRDPDNPEGILLDTDPGFRTDILDASFKRFKLRSKVTWEDVSERHKVMAHWQGDQPPSSALISTEDKRAPEMGFRSIVDQGAIDEVANLSDAQTFALHRMRLGVAETADNFVHEGMPLEANLDLYHGVDFRKGCYIGQELTARTHHTGVVRKRIVPVQLSLENGEVPENWPTIPTGTEVRAAPLDPSHGSTAGPATTAPVAPARARSAGKLLTHINNVGLAMLRLEQISQGRALRLVNGEGQTINVQATIPSWWSEEVRGLTGDKGAPIAKTDAG